MQTTRRVVLVLGIALAAAAVLPAGSAESDLPVMDGVPTAAPEDVGMSSGRLARLERAMQAYVDRGEVAGIVSLVARRGKVVHFSVFGDRVAGGGAPMTHDAIFRIASMTKPMTLNHTGDHDVWLVGPGYGFGVGYAVVRDPGQAAMPYSPGSHF